MDSDASIAIQVSTSAIKNVSVFGLTSRKNFSFFFFWVISIIDTCMNRFRIIITTIGVSRRLAAWTRIPARVFAIRIGITRKGSASTWISIRSTFVSLRTME